MEKFGQAVGQTIAAVHSAISVVVDLLIYPLRTADPIYALIWISALAGVICLLIFGRFSNQAALRRVKDRIYGGLLEALLYRHDIRTCLAAQGRMFRAAGAYLRYALSPMFVMIIPVLFLLAQVQVRFGYRPLKTQEPVLIGVTLAESGDGRELNPGETLSPAENGSAEGVALESDSVAVQAAVRVPAKGEIVWRVGVPAPGRHRFAVRSASLDAPLVTAEVSSGAFGEPGYTIAPFFVAASTSWWRTLLYPGPSLSSSAGVRDIWVRYPPQEYSLLGFHLSAVVVFLIVSLLSGLLASRVLKIEI